MTLESGSVPSHDIFLRRGKLCQCVQPQQSTVYYGYIGEKEMTRVMVDNGLVENILLKHPLLVRGSPENITNTEPHYPKVQPKLKNVS